MAKVVNIKENLPVTILVSDTKVFDNNGIPEDFIKALVKIPRNEIGVERDTFYILTTSALLRFQFPRYIQAFRRLRNLLDACWIRNFQYIMIKKETNV